MSRTRGQLAIRWGSLALGVVLFIGALYYISFPSALAIGRQLGSTAPAIPCSPKAPSDVF